MKSQQFRNTETGETVTSVPLSNIDKFEPYDGRRVYYSAARNVILDIIEDGTGEDLGYYSQKNLAETLAECPDAVAMAQDDALTAHERPFIEPVSEVTKDKFWYFLEVLFPENWVTTEDGETFKMCEYLCGNITTICARIGDRYFKLCDDHRTPHTEILKRCQAFINGDS